MEISEFKIEELRLALTYVRSESPLSIEEEEELDWNEQCRLKLVREKGFTMINVLHHSLAKRYLADMVITSQDTTAATSAYAVELSYQEQMD